MLILGTQDGTPNVVFRHFIGARKATELAFDSYQKESLVAKAQKAKEGRENGREKKWR